MIACRIPFPVEISFQKEMNPKVTIRFLCVLFVLSFIMHFSRCSDSPSGTVFYTLIPWGSQLNESLIKYCMLKFPFLYSVVRMSYQAVGSFIDIQPHWCWLGVEKVWSASLERSIYLRFILCWSYFFVYLRVFTFLQ